ncbi:Hint domain-containing protein [Pseudorhodobacter sp.]|uniref:Hint domain-containing protein n=1 Tax=Pseudorhodobacter sp. TaxID=1934400 RepID=UPI002647CBE1|nr:Hint domain-containing protein [Pseudorhodobacter sp.]MDN5786730.1 Hint domain-containing protein [Pseudorhodobacter sp.]
MADVLRGGIAINEILVDPSGATSFDTDGNGTVAPTDEFIEIVNTSNVAISIAGLQLWDQGIGHWFTFPPGAVLQPGAHAMVITGVQAGGSLPTGGPNDLFYNAGRSGAVITNTGDNVIIYDPTANNYISARFNGDALDNPTLGGGGYKGFSTTASLVGAGEDFGNDIDGRSIQRGPDGSSHFINDQTATPGTTNICFTAGTLIETPTGVSLIEDLRPGDLVMTRDHGAQPVRWLWSKRRTVAEMTVNPKLRPVRFAKGSLGDGLPKRDLYLSQHHRVLVASAIAQRIFETPEVLIAAHCLTGLPGVETVLPPTDVFYFHLLLDAHEILLAEGTASESLFLGEQSFRAMEAAALNELRLLLGIEAHRLESARQSPARIFAAGKHARNLAQRHVRHKRPLCPAAPSQVVEPWMPA